MRTRDFSTYRLLKLDRYLIREVLGAFLGSFIFILFILLMFQVLRLADFFIVNGASTLSLAKVTLYLSISFLPFAIPLALVLSILISFSRISNDSELVALKSLGLSLSRISLPTLILALILGGFNLILNNQIVPWSATQFKVVEQSIASTRVSSRIKEGTFTTSFFNLLIFAERTDQKKTRLYHVFIRDEREASNPLTYIAQEAEIIPIRSQAELGTTVLMNLYNGSMHHHDLQTQNYEKMDFETYQIMLEIEGRSPDVGKKPSMMYLSSLKDEIEKAPADSGSRKVLQCEVWRRYASVLTPIILVIFAIGLSAFQYRNARAGALLLGFIIILMNWILQVFALEVGHRGVLHPAFAMQIPNLISLIMGFFFFKRANW